MTYGNIQYEHPGAPQTVTHIHRQEGPLFQDSVEIGTPSKGGALKIYFNAADPEDAKKRVSNAFQVRVFAQELADRQVG